MITQIKYSFFLTILLATLVTSCSDRDSMNASLIDNVAVKDMMEKSVNRSIEGIKSEEEKENKVSISVIYTGSLDEILLDESSTLYKAIATYHLNLETPFEINEDMKGITLSSYVEMKDPISIGKEISNGASILMVEVKNLPENEM